MSRYDEVRAEHEWQVPERYNIAADVCDRHPPEKLAMIFEDHTGIHREVTWGEQQDTCQPGGQHAHRPRHRQG